MLPAIKAYLKGRVPVFINRRQSRAAQLRAELRFWDKWFRTKGLEWPDDYRTRLDPDSMLAEDYRELIDHLPQEEVRILDVGAGPLTVIGKRHPSKRLLIHAVDVLAEEYQEMLARYDIQPVVRTTFAQAEMLTRWFVEGSFDMVHARNCLDHAIDPLEAIRQILLVTKKDCFALLDHAENEGANQRYSGLHQWDFTVAGGELVIKGSGAQVNVSRQLGDMGDFQCSIKNNWIKVRVRKR